jgi:hypothetical protein
MHALANNLLARKAAAGANLQMVICPEPSVVRVSMRDAQLRE